MTYHVVIAMDRDVEGDLWSVSPGPGASFLIAVPASSLLVLACLGALAARTGGAHGGGAIRVTFWGALAMGVTAGAGALFGTVV